MSDQHNKAQYKNWPSKNGFCCGGRLIHGPDRIYFWTSSFLLIVLGALFIIFVIPELYDHEIIPQSWNLAMIPIFIFFWIYTIIMHNAVAYMDPGIIPRQPPLKMPDTTDPYLLAKATPPVTKIFNVNSVNITVKWCNTCNMYRPPRAIHCGICDNCVHRFDHHCPYVGNCVGLRNYRYFLFFILGVLFCSLFALSHSVTLISLKVQRFGFTGSINRGFIFAWIVAVCSFIVVGLVGSLVGLTCFLITRGRTTNENIKTAFTVKNPYDKGMWENWLQVCCAPLYPPFVRPRWKTGEESPV
jgi:palmitoyltransferase ZDHHC9/14/18